MPSRVIDILVKAGADKSAAQEGARSLMLLKNSIDAAQASMERLGGDSTAKIRAEYIALGEAGKAVQRELDIQDIAEKYYNLGQILGQDEELLIRLRKAMKDVGATEDEVNRATRAFKELQAQPDNEGGKGFSLTGLRRTGSAVEQLAPGTGIGAFLQRIGDIGQVLKEVGNVKDALASVGNESSLLTGLLNTLGGSSAVVATALTALAAAVALFVVGIKIFNDAVSDGKKRLDATLGSQKTFFDFLVTGTTEAAKEQVSSLEKQAAAQRGAREETERAIKLLESQTGINRNVGIAAPGALGDAYRDLTKQLDENNKEISNSEALIGRYTGAIQSNAFAANDAAEAEKKLAAARDAVAEGIITSAVRQFNLSKTATSDQLKDRLAAIDVESVALEKEAKYTALHTDAEQASIESRIKALDAEKKDIEAVQGAVAARERETRVHDLATEAVKRAEKALDDYNKTLEQAGDVQDQIGADRAARDKQLKRRAEDDAIAAERKGVEADFKERIAEAKKNQAIDKLNKDFFDSELKALDAFHTQEEKSDDKSAKNRLRLLEDAADDLFDAAARNDVVAFLNRQRQANKDLERQKEDADEASKERLDAYLKERQQAQDHYTEQLQILTDAGQERNNRAAQLEQELNDIREQWRIDDINRQRTLEEEDFQERMALAQSRYAELLALADSFFQQWKQNFEANAPGTTVMANGEYPTFNTRRGNVTISRFATGADYIPYDKFPAYLDEGEAVLTKREAKEWRGGSGKPNKIYNISVSNTVGDIATKSMLDEAIVTTVTNLTKALDDESDE